MPTLNEVVRGIPQGFIVLAGSTGLGRRVSRIAHLRSADVVGRAVHAGDLVVYAAGGGRPGQASRGVDGALSSLLQAGPAGVLTDLEPGPSDIQAAQKCGSPLLASIGRIETERLRAHLERSLLAQQAVLKLQELDLRRMMVDLACAGATPTMLLGRLAAVTGKAALLQPTNADGDQLVQPLLQDLDRSLVLRAAASSARTTLRWLGTRDVTQAPNVLYLELPSERLVRLVAPVWLDGALHGSLSLLARPDELLGRDHAALAATADAIANAYAHPPLDVAAAVGRRRCAAIVLRGVDATPDDLTLAAREHFEQSRMALATGADDVRLCVALDVADRAEWSSQLIEWHRRLSKELGAVSIGHAARMGTQATDVRYALVEAAEALRIGDRLFGAGHVTSYADAQLASFMLSKRESFELRALFEQVVGALAAEDAKRDRELVHTLEIYCDTYSTQRTADRLQVHRNTVRYRLRQIEEMTSYDLEDGPTRLLLQLALAAGRLIRQTNQPRPSMRVARLRTVAGIEEILSA